MKSKININIRRFLRPKGCIWGNDSTIHAYLEVNKTKAGGKNRHTGRAQKARGSIECSLMLRDCSESISLDFSASSKQKHMISQKAVIHRLILDLCKLEDAYEHAIIELRDEGYIT